MMIVCNSKMDGLLYMPWTVLAKKVGLGLVVGIDDCNFYRTSQVPKRSRGSLSIGRRLSWMRTHDWIKFDALVT